MPAASFVELLQRVYRDHRDHFASLSVNDLIVLLVHYTMVDEGFRSSVASAAADAQQEDQSSSLSSSSSSSTPAAALLPADWNAQSQQAGFYSIQYGHAQSSLSFVMKVVFMGQDVLLLSATALEQEDRIVQLEIRISEYIDRDQWRQRQQSTTTDEQQFIDMWKKDAVERLIASVRTQVARRLVPQSKEGYEEGPSTTTTTTAAEERQQQQQQQQRREQQPYRPYRDYEDDDYDPLRVGPVRRGGPPRGYGPVPAYGPETGVGASDLYPQVLPPMYMPGRGGLGGVGGMGGMPFIGGGGSMVGPGHPMFGAPGPSGFPRPPGVPPGARFDPYGPIVPGRPAPPGRGGGVGGGSGRGAGGVPQPTPPSGEPNPDHARVPRDLDYDMDPGYSNQFI